MSQVTLKKQYSAAELAGMHLSGLPTSKVSIIALADRQNWNYIEVSGRGGMRREYTPPTEIMELIRQAAVKQLAATIIPQNMPVVAPQSSLAHTEAQNLTADARKGVLDALNAVMQRTGYPLKRAAKYLIDIARNGDASPQLVAMLKLARDGRGRSSDDGLPSDRSLTRFVEYQKTASLVPKVRERDMNVPAWAQAFMSCYQQPQKPTVEHAYQLFCQGYQGDLPSIYQVRRFLKKVGNVSLQVGRMGSREIKNIKGFIRRDSSHMWPGDAYTADGHCFDSEIAHPRHGRPFRPEITDVLDIATRKLVGWSIDLAESGLAVLDALHGAVLTGGIPSVFYVDNGSGYRNAMMSAHGVGLTGRLGIEMTHSLPYNSQARGIIERSHQTIWIKAAKELPSFIGKEMDAQAKQVVHKLTRKDIKTAGKSKFLMGFPEFVSFCKEKAEAYNDTPHRGLAKIVDPVTGRKRHMSPNEAWAAGVAEGAALVTISPEESRHLFRPQREVKVLRCEIRLFSNLYHSEALTEHHGEVVRAGYDVRNADKIWVYDQQGRFICEAGFEANKRAYFPEPMLEQAARKRAEGRKGKLLDKLDEVQAELEGSLSPLILENAPSPSLTLPLTGLELTEADYAPRPLLVVASNVTEVQEEMVPEERPLFDVESEQYEWLMQHQEKWTANDARFLQRYLKEDDGYILLSERFSLLGLAWGDQEQTALNRIVMEEQEQQENRFAAV